jgi:hypothetical protein
MTLAITIRAVGPNASSMLPTRHPPAPAGGLWVFVRHCDTNSPKAPRGSEGMTLAITIRAVGRRHSAVD